MKKKNRGVITVEAALVMPVVLATLFLIYSLGLIQYNNVVTRSEAMRIANRVALNWNLIGGTGHNILKESNKEVVYDEEYNAARTASEQAILDFDLTNRAIIDFKQMNASRMSGQNAITSSSFSEHDPYRFFTELFKTGSQKSANINNYLATRMENLALTETGMEFTSTSSVKGDAGYHIFNRYVSVALNNTFSNPIFQLLHNMGFDIENEYSVTAKAKLTEPADFVRNISFLEELMREMQRKK